MYYVIQVAPGTEQKTETLIKERVETDLYDRCFHPLRHVRKKFRGQWRDLHEKLMPGYVFIASDAIADLYPELRRVPALTKLLGRNEGEIFVPLAESEADWLERITEGGIEAGLSRVAVAEGDTVTILSGPLTDMEGRIRKIHLHKRIAEVEVDFMNQKTVIHLGIELVGKEGENGLRFLDR